jgi:predicted amidohydrolase
MSRILEVAALQLHAHERTNFESAWKHALEMTREAARAGASLIVAPEGTVPSYVLGGDPVDADVIARASADVARIASEFGCVIVYGTVRYIAGRAYNSAAVVGPEGQLGAAEKLFLWHFDRRWFSAGNTIEPIATPAGRLGIFICADGRLPTIARALVDRGAELLIVPTAWVSSGRDPSMLENVQADLLAPIRAYENGVPLVAANKVGVERGSVAYCGKSVIVDAAGSIVAQGSQRDEEIVCAQLRIDQPRPKRAALSHRSAPVAPEHRCTTARIALTALRAPERITDLAEMSALGDARIFIAPVAPQRQIPGLTTIALEMIRDETTLVTDGMILTVVGDEIMDPGVLATQRLHGHDCFVWHAGGECSHTIAIARARAVELRAYIVVIGEQPPARAFAVDPDGTIVCGTFDDFECAAFTYERTRTAQTTFAPHTDLLDGLTTVDALINAKAPV